MIEVRDGILKAAMKDASEQAGHWFSKRGNLTAEQKHGDQFVTEADREVERAIRTAILAKFPDDLIIGEEFGGEDKNTPFKWYVDPIDGTSNFLNGLPFWGVSICLAGPNNFLLGAISLPELGLSLIGGTGHPLKTLDGKPVQRFETPVPTVAIGWNSKLTRAQEVAQIDVIRRMGFETVSYRCSSMALALAATGQLNGYFETDTHSWDIAAGWALNLAAGLDVQGRLGGESGTQEIATGPVAILLSPPNRTKEISRSNEKT